MPESMRHLDVDVVDPAGTGRRSLFATLGALGAAVLASLCCIGPLVFVAFGVGAGLASTFAPLRPAFTVLTIALLAVGFYTVYGKKRVVAAGGGGTGAATDDSTGGPDGSCEVPRSRRRDKVILWTATVLAVLLLTFPQWSVILV